MADKKLKDYFPMLKTRTEVLFEIDNNPKLQSIFNSWSEDVQQDFPSQRSSCYSSDLVLRQYKRIRETEKTFPIT